MTSSWHELLLLLVPAVIAAINRPSWSPQLKWCVALVVCLIASAGEIYLVGGNLTTDLVKNVGIVMASYAVIWKIPIPGVGSPTDLIENNINTGSTKP